MSAFGRDHCGDCSVHQLEIEPERTLADVFDVESQSVVKIHVAATADLPKACNTRRNFQPFGMPQGVGVCTEGSRTRTNKAHVATDDVEDLRQLIQTHFSQNPTDASDSWVIADLEIRPRKFIQVSQLMLQFFSVSDHRAQLAHAKTVTAATSSQLRKKDGPGIFDPQGQATDRDDREYDWHQQQADRQVKQSLGGKVEPTWPQASRVSDAGRQERP